MGLSAPHPDLLFSREKSRQKHAREEKPFRWGFSPVTPSSATTQRGAPAPLWKPPHILQSLCSTGEAPRRAVRGRIQRGGRSPPLWSLRGVVLRRGTQSKVSPSYACFWLLFSREKSDLRYGAGGPERLRKETCFFPSRPAMGESKHIGAMCWHRLSVKKDQIFFLMVFKAFFSRRLTWAWEIPTSAETSIWVFPS